MATLADTFTFLIVGIGAVAVSTEPRAFHFSLWVMLFCLAGLPKNWGWGGREDLDVKIGIPGGWKTSFRKVCFWKDMIFDDVLYLVSDHSLSLSARTSLASVLSSQLQSISICSILLHVILPAFHIRKMPSRRIRINLRLPLLLGEGVDPNDTVHGRNLAHQLIGNLSQYLQGLHTSQVVRDFFHQPEYLGEFKLQQVELPASWFVAS